MFITVQVERQLYILGKIHDLHFSENKYVISLKTKAYAEYYTNI